MTDTASFRDLVVLIPGILGSRLVRREGTRDVTVWDFSITNLPRTLRALASGRLETSMLEGPPLDDVRAADLFTYQWLPGFFGVDDYRPIIEMFKSAIGDERQLLTFPYDWRASNRYAAERLQPLVLDALARWRSHSGASDAKLWFVCHSMGGLVARYFCEALDGAKDTRMIVTLGTPHRGAVNALDALVNGKRIGPLNLTDLVRTFPSVYELLPLFPAVRVAPDSPLTIHRIADFFGLDPVTGNDTGKPIALTPLPGLNRTMLKQALQFHAAIRVPAEQRAARSEETPYRQEAFFNRRQPTAVSAYLNGGRLRVLETFPYDVNGKIEDRPDRGDGTVPSFSSLPIEWTDSRHAHPIAGKHAAIQSDVPVIDGLLNWLRPLDVRAKKAAPFDDTRVVALRVPATVKAGEELVIEVASPNSMSVEIQVVDVDRNRTMTRQMLLSGGDVFEEVRFKPLPGGVHRVSVIPRERMLPAIGDYVFVDDFVG